MCKFARTASAGMLCVVMLGAGASATAAEPVGPRLTPKLRDLLRQEMTMILDASRDILEGLVTGDHGMVAERGQAIHDSFILQQSLTEQDRKDLMEAVPPEFVQLDRAFHETAAGLAEAARAEDADRELSLFNELTDGCIQCHARFATDRFPGFAEE